MKLALFKKGMGQFQFSYTTVKKNENDIGCVIIEAASTLKDNPERCAWNEKAVMKLSDLDITTILYNFIKDEKVQLVHKTEKRTSYFNVEPGQTAGTYKMRINNTDGKDVSLYINSVDKLRLSKYLEASLLKIYQS